MKAVPLNYLLCALGVLASCSKPATYQAECSRPLAHWKTPADGYNDLPHNDVFVSADAQFTWNGVPISRKNFDHFLSIIPDMDPQPDVIVVFDKNLNCKAVQEVRNAMDQALGCKELRRCGEGAGDWKGNTNISHVPPPERRAELEALIDDVAEAAQSKRPVTDR